MTPFDETVPVSDPLELAHRQLKDANDRENALHREIASLRNALAECECEYVGARDRAIEAEGVVARLEAETRRQGSQLTELRYRESVMLNLINNYRAQQIVSGGVSLYHEGLGGMGAITRDDSLNPAVAGPVPLDRVEASPRCDCTMSRSDLIHYVADRMLPRFRDRRGSSW